MNLGKGPPLRVEKSSESQFELWILDQGNRYIASVHNGVNPECKGPEYAALFSAAPDLLTALEACLEWIDGVPKDTQLPAMSGIDRDWVNGVIEKAKN